MQKDRDDTGRFSKGNKYAKKDMHRDMARNMLAKEAWWISYLLSDIPAHELNKFIKDNDIRLSIFGTKIVDKFIKGDMKTITWFYEIICGKAAQVTETTVKAEGIKINIDKMDESL